ncbi:winged helix DNA-binding domain-containing protein [Brachybacterium hainanense]|uniref:Winged helix DNA-binding domain-containing protein n=1 Tax=Brachybacterium hainanense TaxID=1541174 RepID=A0ABV6RCQ5_9MICO
MVDPALIRARLLAQGLAVPAVRDPVDLAASFLAMQGQDLPGVIASLALRLAGDDPLGRIANAVGTGRLVRAYPLRGTVFLMAAEDVRWVTQLCAAAPLRISARLCAERGITPELTARGRGLALEAADAPRGIGRAELIALWGDAGVPVAGGGAYHLLTSLVMRGDLVLSHEPTGEERVLLLRRLAAEEHGLEARFDGDEEAAVAELLLRHLASRGPATVRDASWFSKLPLRRLRAALPRIRDQLEEAGLDARGEMRYSRPGIASRLAADPGPADDAFLLPGFDELVLGYPDRLDLIDAEHHGRLVPGNNGVFQPAVVRRGRVIGLWKREGRPGARRLATTELAPWPAVAHRRVRARYSAFPFLRA